MRHSLSLIVVVFLVSSFSLLASCSTSGNAESIAGVSPGMLESPVESDHVTLVVHGMSCPLCANNIDKQLLRLDGVESVDVNLSDGQVGVHLGESSRPTYAQLVQAVDRSGFTLVRIDTP